MAGNRYRLKFTLSDGTTKEVEFTAPQGPEGATPVRGTDYWTAEDKEEIKAYVEDAILGGAW